MPPGQDQRSPKDLAFEKEKDACVVTRINDPPVAVKMAPDIGGPPMVPMAMTDMHIPTRPPASLTSPIGTTGTEKRPTYASKENLDGVSQQLAMNRCHAYP